ncbi:hypothetical protein KZ813_07900 [Sphingomonas sp. RHCKR7]|uniref:hypothetical protein n=1 Tax=Sphingomonas folli TaxID=2862497 RepID=UPI001CA5A1F7|nr:hypothetical protein [Sphingomonas folli]MBW6526757.1 hypothetical protein [Sphingomonas folli]
MPRQSSIRHRSVSEWAVRGAAAACAGVLAYVSVTATLGYTYRNRAPERAHRLAGWDGRVTAVLAARLAGLDGGTPNPRAAARLAREALRQDPTAVTAAAALGLVADMDGQHQVAARLFDYAETLSRRDLPTQLWKIEAAVGRGEVAEAMRHYDIALRTSRHAPDLLFPVLVAAMADPPVRTELVRTFLRRPAWGPLFVEYAAGSSPDPEVTSQLFQDLQRNGISPAPVAQTVLVDTLASRGAFQDAWRYYQVFRPKVDRRRSRDPRFSADIALPTVFDWRIVSDTGVSASLQRGDQGGLLDFAAPASLGGAVAQQKQFLPPGRYRLSGQAGGLAGATGPDAYWVMTCPDGRELGRVDIHGPGGFAGTIEVPDDCVAQTLTLMLRPSDMPSGIAGQILRAEVVPS